MSWQQIVLTVWMAVEILGTIPRIGKERKPITPNEALMYVLIWSAAITLVISG